MHYLQERDISTGRWERDLDEGPFDTALEALERRDEIIAEWPDDGLRSHRGLRAVDENGNILEYKAVEI